MGTFLVIFGLTIAVMGAFFLGCIMGGFWFYQSIIKTGVFKVNGKVFVVRHLATRGEADMGAGGDRDTIIAIVRDQFGTGAFDAAIARALLRNQQRNRA